MSRRDFVLVFLGLLALVATACSTGGSSSSGASSGAKSAEALFEAYQRLEHDFDPDVANLYADDALIRNTRRYPTGEVKEMNIPAGQYKDLLRTAMPAARLKGDTSTYSEVTYTPEGDGVRIRATRYSNLKSYSSPISILARPTSSGDWLIYEELSESQP